MEGIKNLIIDFGGVIINLTRNRCVEAFESFGVPDVRDCLQTRFIDGPSFQIQYDASQ